MTSSTVSVGDDRVSTLRVFRFEVRQLPEAGDPKGAAVSRAAARADVHPSDIRAARVYFIEAAFSAEEADRVLFELLTDPAKETGLIGVDPPAPGAQVLETHPLPGVMDPAAGTVSRAVADLLDAEPLRVATGWRYDFKGLTHEHLERVARELANPVVDSVHFSPWTPDVLPKAPAADQTLKHVSITTLDDDGLERLSREGHLFLSLDEMRGIQQYYRDAGREPTDIELETLAQTWSEHCVHKTLKSTVTYRPAASGSLSDEVIDWSNVPNAVLNDDGSITIPNLLKNTVAAATHELIAEDDRDKPYPEGRGGWCLSVFVDNAGVIRFTDDLAVCVKVETHNPPSAIEPYGGAATGVGGVIRDIIGTGLGAKPVANTDVFCVAPPDIAHVPPGCIHPRKVLTRVIDGVRDYGNRMGIPTLNGAVHFDERYVGNPLVFCGSVGVMPTSLAGSHDPSDPTGKARPGDLIVALGGRTGRDGIHGATFSSAELTDTHTDEFSHAVQIGNAIEEKRVLDAVLRARDYGASDEATERRRDEGKTPSLQLSVSSSLYSAITDCGAGGFSSAVGEMGEKVGAVVHLDRAPLKYDGLRYDEIWISESQERMVLAVPPENLDALRAICDEEHVELAVLGEFGLTNDQGEPELAFFFEGAEVGRLSMPFLHDGVPMPTREAVWKRAESPRVADDDRVDIEPAKRLLEALAHPNTASKRFIVRQYDHEVQGATVVKPLVGPGGRGPSDAAVIQPDPDSPAGLAIACGLAPDAGDPYDMPMHAIDECVRNLVCVGADPDRIAILDNFCWPSCKDPRNMGSLVRAAVGCYFGALMYRTPFISGKDSLNNQFRYTDPATGKHHTIEIPPTLLITGVGVVPDVSKVVTMDLKPTDENVGSHLLAVQPSDDAGILDYYRAMHRLIASGKVLAAHDSSEASRDIAAVEMLLAAGGSFGLEYAGIDPYPMPNHPGRCADGPLGGLLLQVLDDANIDEIEAVADTERFANVNATGALTYDWRPREQPPTSVPVADLVAAYEGTFAEW